MSTLETFTSGSQAASPAEGVAVAEVTTTPLATTDVALSVISTDSAAAGRATPSFLSQVRDFFYAPEASYGIALTRMLICFTLLFVMVPRWYFARELFSSDGAPITLWDAYSTHPWVPNPTGIAAVAVASVVILTLLTSLVGWCTRYSLIVATSGYLYLNMLDII